MCMPCHMASSLLCLCVCGVRAWIALGMTNASCAAGEDDPNGAAWLSRLCPSEGLHKWKRYCTVLGVQFGVREPIRGHGTTPYSGSSRETMRKTDPSSSGDERNVGIAGWLNRYTVLHCGGVSGTALQLVHCKQRRSVSEYVRICAMPPLWYFSSYRVVTWGYLGAGS